MIHAPILQPAQRYLELCKNLEEADQLLDVCHTQCAKLLRRAVLRRDASLLSRILMDCRGCPMRGEQ